MNGTTFVGDVLRRAKPMAQTGTDNVYGTHNQQQKHHAGKTSEPDHFIIERGVAVLWIDFSFSTRRTNEGRCHPSGTKKACARGSQAHWQSSQGHPHCCEAKHHDWDDPETLYAVLGLVQSNLHPGEQQR